MNNIKQPPSPSLLLNHHHDQHHPAPEPVPLHLPDRPQQEHIQCSPAEDQGHDLSQQAKGSENLINYIHRNFLKEITNSQVMLNIEENEKFVMPALMSKR